jgi:hypothetical protein
MRASGWLSASPSRPLDMVIARAGHFDSRVPPTSSAASPALWIFCGVDKNGAGWTLETEVGSWSSSYFALPAHTVQPERAATAGTVVVFCKEIEQGNGRPKCWHA